MNTTNKPKRASWSTSFAFTLAAAASAIGLGNLWRFPYLAAQYGGGSFILIYLVLVVTLGFTLMVSEIAIGRATQQSQLTAFSRFRRSWGILGLAATIVPLLIVPYYCVIGGWVLKYFVTYVQLLFHPGADLLANPDAFFGSFISAPFAPYAYTLVFLGLSALVILLGVKNGIEKSNLVLMPLLFLLAIAICVYVAFLPGAADGISFYLLPNLSFFRTATGSFSIALLAKTVLGAMGQMFYSLSIAMGIMITYGSYLSKTDSIERAVRRIEFFDTLIALLAGFMIIPVVYLFAVKTGTPVQEAMNAGPGLMFITLPKVFATFSPATAAIVGTFFFLLVIFAALTSAISLYEACLASVCDLLHIRRSAAALALFILIAFLAVFSALGYGPLVKVKPFGLPFLDFFDFITNSVLMPLVALGTCLFVSFVISPDSIEMEILRSDPRFVARTLYRVMVRFVAPLLIVAVLVSEICRALGLFGWSI
ncbi:MAG: sodium-dependent transporter [Kiritimatiellae bacterium]|nr:sodium-dependent transporter [Kiritimatiellia bacterium]